MLEPSLGNFAALKDPVSKSGGGRYSGQELWVQSQVPSKPKQDSQCQKIPDLDLVSTGSFIYNQIK